MGQEFLFHCVAFLFRAAVIYSDGAWQSARSVFLYGKRLARSEQVAVARREMSKSFSAIWCFCKVRSLSLSLSGLWFRCTIRLLCVGSVMWEDSESHN